MYLYYTVLYSLKSCTLRNVIYYALIRTWAHTMATRRWLLSDKPVVHIVSFWRSNDRELLVLSLLIPLKLSHLNAITRLLIHYRDVGPVKHPDKFHHCLGLVHVRWNGSEKERIAISITQLCARAEKAYLKVKYIHFLSLFGQKKMCTFKWCIFTIHTVQTRLPG